MRDDLTRGRIEAPSKPTEQSRVPRGLARSVPHRNDRTHGHHGLDHVAWRRITSIERNAQIRDPSPVHIDHAAIAISVASASRDHPPSREPRLCDRNPRPARQRELTTTRSSGEHRGHHQRPRRERRLRSTDVPDRGEERRSSRDRCRRAPRHRGPEQKRSGDQRERSHHATRGSLSVPPPDLPSHKTFRHMVGWRKGWRMGWRGGGGPPPVTDSRGSAVAFSQPTLTDLIRGRKRA